MVANILLADPYPSPTPLGLGSKFNHFHNMVMLLIKDNHERRKMVANVLPASLYYHPDPEDGVNRRKFSSFRTWVMLQIKLKRLMQFSIMVAIILPADHNLRGRGQNSIFFQNIVTKFIFSENGHVAYQVKGNHEFSHIVANILPAD